MNDERTILITGATDGLGRALADRLASRGATVLLHGRMDTLATGVAATDRLVSDDGLAKTTGRFFDRTRETRADAQAYDPAARELLWRRSLELVGADDVTL